MPLKVIGRPPCRATVTMSEMEPDVCNVWDGDPEDARPVSDAVLSPDIEHLVCSAMFRTVYNAKRMGSEFEFYNVDAVEGEGGSLLLLLPIQLNEDAVVPLVIMEIQPEFWEWDSKARTR